MLVRPVPPGTPEKAAGTSAPLAQRSAGATQDVTDLAADWFASLIQTPFANDEAVLDRIVVTLRTL
ncbi:hypothetical protein ACIA5C_46710 [Actinoplanes sp. NPDC051343]|uniref:hypothetical protein n=1 Tax=Actinoplanes sp. NPDC051343 TaxID=3363906 RepID=UPI00378CFCEC